MKIILLDPRYEKNGNRFFGTDNLGEKQWEWLTKELETNQAQVVLIASSNFSIIGDRGLKSLIVRLSNPSGRTSSFRNLVQGKSQQALKTD